MFNLNSTESFSFIKRRVDKTNFLTWAGLRQAVPREFKNNTTPPISSPSFVINNNVFDITKKKSKHYYSLLINKKGGAVASWLVRSWLVASWLVRSTPERAVRVRALAGDIVLCSWARHFTLTVPLSTQVYKWVPAICWGNLTKLRGSDLRWTSIPSRGSRNTSSRLMLQKPG